MDKIRLPRYVLEVALTMGIGETKEVTTPKGNVCRMTKHKVTPDGPEVVDFEYNPEG